MSQDFIVFGRPTFREEEIEAVAQVLRSGWISTGPKTGAFENAFAKYQNCAHAVGTASCTSALLTSLKALGIGVGDEVITSALTFGATINAIIQSGAKPVLVDVEPRFGTLDIRHAEKAITKKTRAIIPVHLAGAPADMDALMDFKERFHLKLIHDCAHAIETEWNGKKIGAYSDVACYSFYPTKNLTTIEGGMICSNDDGIIERARFFIQQGMSKGAHSRFTKAGYSHYDIVSPGFKFNMTDVQAALGLCQLQRLEERHAERKKLWNHYLQAFRHTPFELPADVAAPHRHGYHLFRIGIAGTRDAALAFLQQNAIGSGVHYRAIPMLTHYHQTFGWDPKRFPHAVRIGESTLSLPFTPYLSEAEIERIVSAVNEFVVSAHQSQAA